MKIKFPLRGIGRALEAGRNQTSTGLFGNPLLSSPRGFDQLASQVEQKSMALVQQIIEKDMRPSRTENLASPSTKTTVAMVDDLSNEICCGADLTECTRSMHCDPAFGEAAERSMRKYTGLVETLNTTPELYHALKNSLTKEKSSLDEISIRTANLLLEDFENSGVHLEEDKRREFVQLSDQIFDAGVNFSNGVDAQVPISDEEATRYGVDISELSNPWRTSKDYRIRKFTHGKFFMHDPVREAHLCRLVSSRHQMAKLTGFESYAHRAQGHSILQTYQNVQKFLNGLIDSMTPRIGEEMETIRTFVSENSINFNAASDAVGEWDLDFAKHIYRQRILEQVGDLSDYFSFETVFSGFETIVNKLYGLTLDVRSPEAGEVWPGNVLKLDVYQEDQHQFLGTIYVDLDYRASKMQGDCHFTVRCSKQLNNGEYQTPIVVLSLSVIPPANYFTRSSATLTLEDVSMDFQQAENFFHEMGHAIHSMLGRTRFQHVAGTRCPADFAEIPSHLMECFFNDPAVLTKICRDKSGRPMSMDQAEALISSRNIFGITRTLQQVLYALFDLELHGPYAQAISDGKLTTTELFKQLSDIALPGLERTPNYAYHHRITHLVTYGAKYYSYLVARSSSSLIYDTLFAGNPFSRENGLKWAKVQSHGGEYPSLELLSRVLSKQPDAQQLTGVLQNAVMSDVTKTVPK